MTTPTPERLTENASINYPLFKHMSDEHELTLTESEMWNIVEVVRSIPYETKSQEHPLSHEDEFEAWWNKNHHPAPKRLCREVWMAAAATLIVEMPVKGRKKL